MIIADEQAMLDFGKELAGTLKPGDWLAINGTLGAGKTVLCKGILRELGFAGEVSSPSYALVHQYDPPDVQVPVVHADLYRLDGPDDLDELGLDDGHEDCITLIEWAERAGESYGNPSHIIMITPLDDGTRKLEIKTHDK